MNPQCPRCTQVFIDYTACAALTCSRSSCNGKFCALCLADCGGDAHGHVSRCSLNPRKGELFVNDADWPVIIQEVKRNKLQTYWATLEPEVKDTLAADASVRQIFRDLRLDGQLGAAAFAEQVAQLRGMGFTDERAMRRALSEAGGDVAAALEVL